MKLKHTIKTLCIALLALQLGSCDDKESADPKFDQNPTQRLNAQQKELNDILQSSEFGWKAVYFIDNTRLGGYTHLFKFKDGLVDMASDYDDDTAVYNSEYNIVLGSTVSLLFTTKNRIHLLSSLGLKGDFQFLYYGQENGQILFKSNRNFQEVRFIKATAADWTDLPKNRAMIANVIGAPTRPLFRILETNDGTTTHKYDFSFDSVTRFATNNSIETGSIVTTGFGIGYTPTGITISPALELGNQKITDFIYDPVTGNFNATGTNGVTASVKYTNKALILTNDYKVLLPQNANLGFVANSYNIPYLSGNSPLFVSIHDKINAALPPKTNLMQIKFLFNTPSGSYIEYVLNSNVTYTQTSVFHFFNLTSDEVNGIIILNPTTVWKSGTSLATAVDSPASEVFKELDDQLMNPQGLYFKRIDINTAFGLFTSFTFTSASSPFRMETNQL